MSCCESRANKIGLTKTKRSDLKKQNMLQPLLDELHREKTSLPGFQPGPTQTTEDGWRLEVSDLGSRGIVLSV